MNKKTIAVIGLKGLPAFGGAATVGQNIIDQLNQSFKFTVFAVDSHASTSYKLGDVKQHIFKSFPIKKLNIFIYYIRCCLFVIFKGDYDLIHLHHTDGAFILPFLRLKYKVVLTSHARPQDNSKWPWYVKLFFKFNEIVAINFASVFTVVSKPLQETYKRNTTKEIKYIPNGINLSLLADIDLMPKGTEDCIVFAAGRIIPLKGLHLLLEALNKLEYKGCLKVVGNLDQMPSYKNEILGLAKDLNIEFLGLVKDKLKLLCLIKRARLFVFPSLTEAMSIMLLEAAMVRVPILCSDIPANTAVFTEDELTFFKSNNMADLGVKIQYCFNHKRETMSKTNNAFTKLKNDYTWGQISLEYRSVYNILL